MYVDVSDHRSSSPSIDHLTMQSTTGTSKSLANVQISESKLRCAVVDRQSHFFREHALHVLRY
jgi:hypothetical protein